MGSFKFYIFFIFFFYFEAHLEISDLFVYIYVRGITYTTLSFSLVYVIGQLTSLAEKYFSHDRYDFQCICDKC